MTLKLNFISRLWNDPLKQPLIFFFDGFEICIDLIEWCSDIE